MHRFTSDQHPKSHLVAIGKREFDHPCRVPHTETCRDDGTAFACAAGVGDPATVGQRSRAAYSNLVIVLERVNIETNSRQLIDFEELLVPCVQG